MNMRLGREIHAAVSGSAHKQVCCEQCSHNYEYSIEREGTGEGFAWLYVGSASARSEAEVRAARELRKQLRKGQDLVPCPQCCYVQGGMVEEARSNKYEWLTVVAAFAGLIFIYALPLSVNAGELPFNDRAIAHGTAFSAGMTAFGAAFLQSFLRKRYNPNDWPLVLRLEIARARCTVDAGIERPQPGVAGAARNQLVRHANAPATLTSSAKQATTEEENDGESVSSADQSNALYFFLIGLAPVLIGILLLSADVQKWRALAAFGLAGAFWFFGYMYSQRKT